MRNYAKNRPVMYLGIFFCLAGALFLFSRNRMVVVQDAKGDQSTRVQNMATVAAPMPALPPLDTKAYDAKILELANLPLPKPQKITSSTATSTALAGSVTSTIKKSLWPAKAPYPNAGSVIPFKRIIAYYGNFYSTQMGVLGKYPPDEMLQRLASTTAEWAAADPATPAIPALDYIVVTAQASAGQDGMYRARMPKNQIQKAIDLAAKVNGIVFLDVQVGLSSVQKEIPLLKDYLKLPQVHLALDPEFAMHNGIRPGTLIGTMDAADINYAAEYLAQIVRDNNLPPKTLVVHRFTEEMVTHSSQIKPLPEVQIVMDMDGFGFPAKKVNTYQRVVVSEPVQFTGFKLFYKNDTAGPQGHLMTPEEILKLSPRPIYIQYQ